MITKQNIKKLQQERRLELRLKVIEVLLNEFKFRRNSVLHYSIRSFARDMGMNHVHLNQVLLNQRGLSRKKAEIIAREFNLNYAGRLQFYRLVSASCARSVLARNLAFMGLKNEARVLKLKR